MQCRGGGRFHQQRSLLGVDCLAEPYEKRGSHELQNFEGLLRLASRDQAQGIYVLVVLLRALDVRGDGIRQIVQLGQGG